MTMENDQDKGLERLKQKIEEAGEACRPAFQRELEKVFSSYSQSSDIFKASQATMEQYYEYRHEVRRATLISETQGPVTFLLAGYPSLLYRDSIKKIVSLGTSKGEGEDYGFRMNESGVYIVGRNALPDSPNPQKLMLWTPYGEFEIGDIPEVYPKPSRIHLALFSVDDGRIVFASDVGSTGGTHIIGVYNFGFPVNVFYKGRSPHDSIRIVE